MGVMLSISWGTGSLLAQAPPPPPSPSPTPPATRPPAPPAAPPAPAPAPAPAGVHLPEVKRRVEAVYPKEQEKSGVSAVVVLRVVVKADGQIGEVTMAQTAGEAFDRAATEAVKQWEFQPATRNGQPVPSRIAVQIRFAPPGTAAPVVAAPTVPAAPPGPAAAPPPAGAGQPAPGAGQPPAGAGQTPPAAGQPGSPPGPPTSPAGVPTPAPVGPAPGLARPGGGPASPAPGAAGAVAGAGGPSPVPAGAAPASAGATPPGGAAEEPIEVTVRGRRPPPPRSTSDFVLGRDVLDLLPRQSGAELLSTAPGVYISRIEGEGVAHEIYLRGFNAEHGQDLELRVGPVGINQPSHLHGQGYADLNFVIPEVVRSLRVTEGVYDPRQGDFAVAGTVEFDLGVTERGLQLKSQYGSFNSFRQLILWAPRDQAEETFIAVAVRNTSGFGQNRASLSGSTIAQYAYRLPFNVEGLVHVAAYGVRAGLAGVVRADDVAAGRVGFYDSYNDPSAQSQSALSSRFQIATTLERPNSDGSRTGIALYFVFTDFRLRENFTGYLQRSMVMPQWVGRGDLIDQEDHDLALGMRAFHRSQRLTLRPGFSGVLELGVAVRHDRIDQAQNLLQAPNNETWDHRVDASIRGTDLGAYLDADLMLTRYVRVRGGVRVDVLYYDVDDRLGNFIGVTDRQTYLPGFRRTALGAAVGPRATVEVRPLDWLTVLASYGRGYRSPQARLLSEGENAPYTTVQSVEGGFKLRLGQGDKLTLTTAGYATFLSDDLVFDAAENRLDRIGATSRKGLVAYLQARPWKWLFGSLSVTYVHATLDAPPPASPENPTPAYKPGELLPYVPPVVLRLDVGAAGRLFDIRSAPVVGKAGAGYTYLAPRPLPYGQFTDPVNLLDLSASVRWKWIELGLAAQNVLNLRYAASEFVFVSDWKTQPIPSAVPAAHISAGPPFGIMGTLALYL
jgi:TonB family protein